MGEAPRFAADAMVGTLARWLRLLGYDCFYEADIPDPRLIEVARSEGRTVLTRDRGVARKAASAFFVGSDDLDDQLLAVMTEFKLEPPEEPPATRCSLCNALLIEASRGDAQAGGVPPRVIETRDEFFRCPKCRRVYWRGTHTDSMRVRLARLRARLQPTGAQPGPDSVD